MALVQSLEGVSAQVCRQPAFALVTEEELVPLRCGALSEGLSIALEKLKA
jgi:hypothetical protein